jgi:imidazolonepropionase-like amidohydrolase
MVLVENGKVVAAGSQVSVENEVPLYDLGSCVVSPGLVSGQTQLGLAAAIDDPAEADAGHVRVADVYDPQARAIRELRAGGFTSVLFAPGSANVVAGAASGVKLRPGDPVISDAGVKFVLTTSSRGGQARTESEEDAVPTGGRGRRGGGGRPSRYPGSLAGQIELVEHVLSGRPEPSELYVPARVRQQLMAERGKHAAALLERQATAYFEVHTRAEVNAALQLIGRFKLRGALIGPQDIRPFVDEMKRLGVGIVVKPAQAADYDRIMEELAAAAAAGVPVAFGSGSAEELRITAALAMNTGLSSATAWRGLTTAAADMAGLAADAGQIAPGRSADLVIWDGSPLNLRSRPLYVIVEGKQTR